MSLMVQVVARLLCTRSNKHPLARLLASFLTLTEVSRTLGEHTCLHGRSLLQVRQQYGGHSIGARAPTSAMSVDKLVSGANAPMSYALGTETSGASAPLNEVGYRIVANLCCRYDMALFIKRAVRHEGYEVCSAGGIQGIVWWFDCPADGYNNSYASLVEVLAKATGGECPWLRKTGGTCKERASNCPSFPDSKPAQPCTTTTTSEPLRAAPLNDQTSPLPITITTSEPLRAAPLNDQTSPLPTTTAGGDECVVELHGFSGWKATFSCCEPGKTEHVYRGGKWYREFKRTGARNDDTKRLDVFGHDCKAIVFDGGKMTGWSANFSEGHYLPAQYSRAGAFKGVSSMKVIRKNF